MTPPGPPIAITGYGTVGAMGSGPEALAAGLLADGPRLTEIDRSGGYHRPRGARFGALVDAADFDRWLMPRTARRMSPPSRFAVVATRIALDQAGLDTDAVAGATAVVTATAYGPSSYTEELLRQIYLDQPTAASPSLFTEAVANAPAAQIALACGARGPNLTVTQRQAGPLLAVARGAATIARGRAERALVAAVDELNPLLHAALDRFGALAGSRGGPEVARPFDRRRRGFVAGEGATALVLEPLGAARRRGAPVLGILGPSISAFDPRAPVAGWPADASSLGDALTRGLARHGLDPAGFDRVVCGAAGSPAGDRLEAGILRRAWGELGLPPLVAPKAYFGDHGGAVLAAAMAGLAPSHLAPTPGFTETDPRLAVVPFAGGAMAASRCTLISAPAVGGAAAWLVLEGANA